MEPNVPRGQNTLDRVTPSAHLLFQRACALHESGDLEQAKSLCWATLKQQPKHVEALNRLGTIVGQLGDLPFAVQVFRQALLIDPTHVTATYNRGIALYNLRRFDAALLHYDRVIELMPDCSDAHFSRGNVLRDLGRLQPARASFEQALALRHDNVECLVNLGNVLRELGLTDAALDSFDRAIELRPDFAEAHCNRAHALLLGGDFDRGWLEYEWRRKNPTSPLRKDAREFSQPLWLGEQPIAGLTLMLHSEQGLGDTLQFCRYAKRVSELGARVILEVPSPLVTLLQDLAGVSQIIARGAQIPPFDYHCSLMSLPRALRTSIATIPNHVPYLCSNSERRRAVMSALAAAFRQRGVPDRAASLAAQVGMAALGHAVAAWFESGSTALGAHVEQAFIELRDLSIFAPKSGSETEALRQA